jgi:hypothetical protein
MARHVGAAAVAVPESNAGFCVVRGAKRHVRRAVPVLGRTGSRPVMAGITDIRNTGKRIVDAVTSQCRRSCMA